MKKSIILILAVVVLLSSGITSAVECGPIPVDGCTITKDTVFNKDVYLLPNGIKIWNDSITLDCNEATLIGDRSFFGIYVIGSIALGVNKDVIVKNCEIREYTTGISFGNCKDCQILNNKVINNNYGITISRDNSIVAHNIIKNNSMGIISTSENNKIYDNIVEFNHDTAIIIDSSTLVFNNNIFNNGEGISSGLSSHNNNVSNNNIINNEGYGIAIFGNNNLIVNNTIINNSLRGIGLLYSENSNIINNDIRENKLGGISFDHVKFTTIKNNNIINNSDGIVIGYSSSDNAIEFNNIFDNEGYNLENNLVIGVNAEYNWWGTTVESEINESIYDYYDNDFFGIVDYEPWLNRPFDALGTKFSITLSKGWNLLSIPLILDDNSVSSVFGSLSYSKLFYYDSAWKVPTEINNTQGYWIKMNNADTLTVEGLPPESTPPTLNQGWNLIGCPYLYEKNISDLYSDATVYTYNNSQWYSYNSNKPSQLNTLNKFTPGYGYWIKIK